MSEGQRWVSERRMKQVREGVTQRTNRYKTDR